MSRRSLRRTRRAGGGLRLRRTSRCVAGTRAVRRCVRCRCVCASTSRRVRRQPRAGRRCASCSEAGRLGDRQRGRRSPWAGQQGKRSPCVLRCGAVLRVCPSAAMLVSVPRQSASGGLYLQAVATPQMEAARKLFEGGGMSTVSIRSITPILIVRAIEPCLEFWEKLGSKVIAQVPRGDVLGFLWFSLGEQTVMLQTEDSAEADVKISPAAGGGVVYLSVWRITYV